MEKTERKYGKEDFLGITRDDIQPEKLLDLPAEKIMHLMYWNLIAPTTEELKEIGIADSVVKTECK